MASKKQHLNSAACFVLRDIDVSKATLTNLLHPSAMYHSASLFPAIESQNHRIVAGVGRDLCGSSSPTLLLKQGHLQQAAQFCFGWVALFRRGHAKLVALSRACEDFSSVVAPAPSQQDQAFAESCSTLFSDGSR